MLSDIHWHLIIHVSICSDGKRRTISIQHIMSLFSFYKSSHWHNFLIRRLHLRELRFAYFSKRLLFLSLWENELFVIALIWYKMCVKWNKHIVLHFNSFCSIVYIQYFAVLLMRIATSLSMLVRWEIDELQYARLSWARSWLSALFEILHYTHIYFAL